MRWESQKAQKKPLNCECDEGMPYPLPRKSSCQPCEKQRAARTSRALLPDDIFETRVEHLAQDVANECVHIHRLTPVQEHGHIGREH